jgi:hypothetical protein
MPALLCGHDNGVGFSVNVEGAVSDVTDDSAKSQDVPSLRWNPERRRQMCPSCGDGLAVVDPWLRVRGIDGLRIADASVMPSVVSANTNATVLAIAEKAATLISPDARG